LAELYKWQRITQLVFSVKRYLLIFLALIIVPLIISAFSYAEERSAWTSAAPR
jgi:hypothetical protein